MEPSNSSLDTTVLLSEASQGQDQSTEKRCLSLRNVLDVEEAKTQILFSLPMILTNVFYYAIALVSVMFAGHLGELDLAGATLANSWANVTGYAFMDDLLFPSSLDIANNSPQCSSPFQSRCKNTYSSLAKSSRTGLRQVGLSGALETLCGQGFGAKTYNMLGIYLQASCIISFLFSIIISILWFYTEPILIFLHQQPDIAKKADAYLNLEYWAFEILVLLAGLMPNSEITTSLVAMCVNTEAIAFNFTYGLSAAASTRVSNELGAEKPEKAKKAMAVTLQLVVLLALIVVLALVFGHDTWAGFFSDSPSIIEDFATMTPFLAISIAVDSFQSVLSGVARGLGWQHMVVVVNLASYYVVGMPIAAIAGFKFKLYAKGLWIGLICGLLSQFAILLVITFHRRWSKIDISAERDEENSVD
ncbi:hypothetical protein GOBAR_DD26703 [Gossypium barbadense]|nr:hypothetical protein GOBAR_DD26703 [Gossypium barbadense]